MAGIVKKNRSPCAACRGLHKKCDTSEGYPCKGCESNMQKARLCRPSKIRKSSRTEKVDSVRLLAGEQLEFYQKIRIAATNNSFQEVQADATSFVQTANIVTHNGFQALPMLGAYVQTREYAWGSGPPFNNMRESKPLAAMNSRLPSFGAVPSPNVQSFEANQVFEHGHSERTTHGGSYTFNSNAYPEGVPPHCQDTHFSIGELGDVQGMWLPEGSFDEYPTEF